LHPVSIKDTSFSFIFSGNIEYYSTVFIGRVRRIFTVDKRTYLLRRCYVNTIGVRILDNE